MADHHDEAPVPLTWPFRLAGTLGLAAIVWFCLGFAAEDVEKHLTAFWEVFWGLMFACVAMVVVGAAMNVLRERRHTAS
ncbi:MAG: hypothetical protein ACR2N6_00110 [Miltoncostaeaceae bacterium]